jgi:hypothetical protein
VITVKAHSSHLPLAQPRAPTPHVLCRYNPRINRDAVIAGLFAAPVDVVDREGLKAYVRPSAERDAVHAV